MTIGQLSRCPRAIATQEPGDRASYRRADTDGTKQSSSHRYSVPLPLQMAVRRDLGSRVVLPAEASKELESLVVTRVQFEDATKHVQAFQSFPCLPIGFAEVEKGRQVAGVTPDIFQEESDRRPGIPLR